MATPALAQVSTKVSNLPSASMPLSAADVFPVVQSGVTKKVSASNLLPLSSVTAGTYGDSTHCASFTVGSNGLVTSASQDTSCPGSGGGDVSSVFGRTGDVVATQDDYAFSQLSSIPTTVSGYGITDAATLTGSQTLTNKTLTAPVISTITNTGTLTLPTSTDTLVGRATTDTLTNKTLTAPTMTAPVLGTIASGNGAALTNLNPANLSTFVSTAKGGLGADNSAASGVPLFTSGTNAMTATTGTGNVVRATSPTLVTPAIGTPASGNASNLTNIPVAQATGVLPAANGGAGTVSGILKANGSGMVSAATSGTDYAPAGTGAYITGDTTITAADWAAFKIIVVNAASKTITLPAAGTLQANGGGLIIVTKNAVTLAIDSTDAINGGTTGASLALSANQNIVVATDGVHAITALNGSGGVSAANPTATASDTAVNGSASTFMRSDAAPAIQKASSSQFGVVKVDGSTITASGGVISAVGGSGVSYAYVPGAWMMAEAPGVSLGSGQVPSANTIIFEPFLVTGTMTPSDFGLQVTTVSSGGKAQVAIYANSTSWIGPTGAPIIVSNDISTTATGAIAAGGLVTSGQLTPGVYWRGTNHDNASAIFKSYTNNNTSQNLIAGSSTLANIFINSTATGAKITLASTYNTWPTIANNSSFTYAAAGSNVPAVAMKIGSVP